MKTQSSVLHHYFRPAELALLAITLITLLADALLILSSGQKVFYFAYSAQLVFAALMFGLSFIYRRNGRSELIGAVTMCTGLFVVFTAAMGLLNYLFLPNLRPSLDWWLVSLDARLGYNWVEAVTWSVSHPLINDILRYAYTSNLYQIVVLIVLLGFSGRIYALHGMIMTLTLSGAFTVLFWILFPSIGPSALFPLPEAVTSVSRQIVGTSYGNELTNLLQNGTEIILPNDTRGLISFPSFHTVMALAGIWYSRSVKWLFPFFLLLNLAVLPAVLVHGGHHLVDIPAGMAVFALCAWATERFQQRFDRQGKTIVSRRLQKTSMSHPA